MAGTPKHEPMVMVKELCIDCAVCREVCPYTAVFFVPTKWKIALQVDQARCTGCGGPEHAPCVQFCPSPGALVPASAPCTRTRQPTARASTRSSSTSALDVLADLSGLRVVDLTHPLHPLIPYWPGVGYGPFRYQVINTLERDHKAAGVFEMPEHMGTHLDAPSHFVHSDVSVDRVPITDLICPAVVFDISSRAAADAGALLELAEVEEQRDFPSGALALVHSGWAPRWSDPDAFRNGMRFPAISEAAAQALLDRGVVGIGVDTLSADNGLAVNSPVHRLVHAAGAYILENLANLDQLPQRGAFVMVAPLPIQDGTGAPARVLAFCDPVSHNSPAPAG